MSIKALICVRGGSVRVKDKNIRPFANTNLLKIKLEQLTRIKELDGIIVNSDSDEMLDIAKQYQVETIKRDPYYASSSISANEFYKNVATTADCDIILSTTVTTPLVKDETFRLAINTYNNLPEEYDSLMTVVPLKDFLWKDGIPLNYDRYNKPKSQDLPENYVILNHAINILPRELMISQKDIIGKHPYMLKMNKKESVDIDTQLDFDFAEFLYNKSEMN